MSGLGRLALVATAGVVVATSAWGLGGWRAGPEDDARAADRAANPTAMAAPAETPAATTPAPPQSWADLNAPYDAKYHFVRIRYDVGGGGMRGFGGFGRRREPPWGHDYPRAESNFLKIVDEVTLVDAQLAKSNVLTFDDPELFKYPIAYMVEVGYWQPTDEEVESLGDYLRKGGFLIVDDTRGERGFELDNFAYHMRRALPELELLPLSHDHKIFDSFFRIDPLAVIPMYGPRDVQYYGIFEENDPTKRLMVVMNFNNDIAEYWEYSDFGYVSIDLTNEAYKLGDNYIVYALTH